ncbi:MAG: aspartate aminotransferase family protein [Crocinitomicaceae bacterium]|nr:aspartate aminotransferase family protein [Crocinitomicaceae bacterium]MCF8434535.1 aspartate aminotransferase family protein [Crocinitomicaceae bacterium]
MLWKKYSQEKINHHVFTALEKNISYTDEIMLGVPASYLDDKVFSKDSNILKNAPFLTTMVDNPNHIGCHTFGTSESFFSGTQEIERDVIRICSENIFNAAPESCDGYIASGGTEANLEAIWIYRNYFMQRYKASIEEIAILCSSDSHYSMDKASNLLNIGLYKVSTNDETREVQSNELIKTIRTAKENGTKYFIVIANMMTTMFGSADDIELYISNLTNEGVVFRLHIDAAYGGFFYPFANKSNPINFSNPHVSSITMDAHKMAQAPYGTGIFLIRKGYMSYASTREASYVEGEDCTIIGSRSGANAVAVWMILAKYGPHGWFEKVLVLQRRTDWLCEQLIQLGIQFYRNPFSNIVTIRATSINSSIAHKYHLIPDNHHDPNWYKIVVMEHVLIDKMEPLIEDLKN